MAGGASANPSNLSATPMSTRGATAPTSAPHFTTIPSFSAASDPSATYALARTNMVNAAPSPYTQYTPTKSRMPASISGYGNFPQAPTSVVTGGPTAEQVRAQMLAYQQQYQPGIQQAQQQVQQFNTNLRAAEEARKAEIARKAAEAAAAAEAERLRREQVEYGSAAWFADQNGWTGAQGGLTTLQGFER